MAVHDIKKSTSFSDLLLFGSVILNVVKCKGGPGSVIGIATG